LAAGGVRFTRDQCGHALDSRCGIACIRLKSLSFLVDCVVRPRPRNNSPARRNHFLLSRRHPETPHGYRWDNENGGQRRPRKNTGDSQMRTLSFFLAFAFVLAGPSIAGSWEGGLPGVGTFDYNGSPIAAQAIVVATR
jgi:hypothetical protein